MTPAQYTMSNEGCRLEAYQDTLGVWTIGYGCTGDDIAAGTVWTQSEADGEFMGRYRQAILLASRTAGTSTWQNLDLVRQAVLADMAYQLGGNGLAGFYDMLDAIREADWQGAHNACLISRYAIQTPARAERSAQGLLTGEIPGYQIG